MAKVAGSRIKKLIKSGAEIAGSTLGGLVGALMDGPAGAAVGGATVPILTNLFEIVGSDIQTLLLSPRQEVKVGGTFVFALTKIKERIDTGEHLRSDWFYQDTEYERPVASEVFEGALLMAQGEHEELKLKHYGYLVANMCFSSVDRGYANFMLRLANRLSYRQLCLIELFSDSKKYELYRVYLPPPDAPAIEKTLYMLRGNTRRMQMPTALTYQAPLKDRRGDLSQELRELVGYGLLNEEGKITVLSFPETFEDIVLTSFGSQLRDMMILSEINPEHIEEVASILRYTERGL